MVKEKGSYPCFVLFSKWFIPLFYGVLRGTQIVYMPSFYLVDCLSAGTILSFPASPAPRIYQTQKICAGKTLYGMKLFIKHFICPVSI